MSKLHKRFATILVVAFYLAGAVPTPAAADGLTRQTVQMLDYLGRDYQGAVDDGAVINEFEYAEQLDFAETVRRNLSQDGDLRDDPSVTADAENLLASIRNKAPAEEIQTLTDRLRRVIIERSGLPVAPATWPSVRRGEKLYRENCAVCHGLAGDGKGPQSKGLNPPPGNFLAPATIATLTPFQAFNTVRNGIPGTAMAPYAQWSDEQVWDVSFHLFSLRHADSLKTDLSTLAELNQALPSLTQLATLTDPQLAALLAGAPEDREQLLAALRVRPQELFAAQTRLTTAREEIEAALSAYAAGRPKDAERHALAAYLEGIEPFEVRLAARDAAIVADIEGAMFELRSTITERRALADVEQAVDRTRAAIVRAEDVLAERTMSYIVMATTSLLIMLREGFEAVLVIVALLAVLRRLKADKARRWVHLGWTTALAAGALTWVASETFLNITGADREIIEGVVALVAVVVLIYMGIWLHNQAEIRKWAAFVNEKARRAVAEKRFVTFFGIAFLAVYREAFETVLFYRALALDTTEATRSALFVGLIIGVIGILVLTWAMLRVGSRIPMRRFFQASSAIIFVLTVVLLGKGIHALQEAGWIQVSSFPVNVRSDMLGVYPTWESLLPQALLIVLLLVIRRLLNARMRKSLGAKPA